MDENRGITVFCDGAFSRKLDAYSAAYSIFGPRGEHLITVARRLERGVVFVRSFRWMDITEDERDFDPYFGDVLIHLGGEKATSNTAEITALAMGLETVSHIYQSLSRSLGYSPGITVWSDSTYALGLMRRQYFPNTRANLLMTSQAMGSIANLRERSTQSRPTRLQFQHCRGHRGEFGNEVVDSAASILLRRPSLAGRQVFETYTEGRGLSYSTSLAPVYTLERTRAEDLLPRPPAFRDSRRWPSIPSNPTIEEIDTWLTARFAEEPGVTIPRAVLDLKFPGGELLPEWLYRELEETCPVATQLFVDRGITIGPILEDLGHFKAVFSHPNGYEASPYGVKNRHLYWPVDSVDEHLESPALRLDHTREIEPRSGRPFDHRYDIAYERELYARLQDVLANGPPSWGQPERDP